MSTARRPIIFIVDDDALVRRSIERTLRGPWVLHSFETAIDAEKRVDELKPDLVVSDNAMPIKPGFAFLLDLRAKHARIRTMLLSATADDERFVRALADGSIDAVMAKPWEPKELRSVIRRLLDLDEHDMIKGS